MANGLSFLPPFLTSDFNVRRSIARERLVEILVAELGDATHKSPYLIVGRIPFLFLFLFFFYFFFFLCSFQHG
jgi:hypothetical protein